MKRITLIILAVAAIVYSLIGTCKAAGIEPRQWLEDVLRQMPYYERDGKELSALLPREWAKTHQPES